MKRFLQFAFFSLLVAPLGADGSSAAPLTLAAALERADGENPALAAERFRERAAAGRAAQAALRPNPTLDVSVENFLGTGELEGVRSFEATVQATQTLERGGKREKRIALAGHERTIAARDFAVQRADVLSATAVAFAHVLAAQQRHDWTGESLQLARETLAAVEARFQAGAASTAETARARAAVASAQAEFARSQTALSAARTALAAKWGGNAAEVGTLAGHLHIPDLVPAEETFLGTLDRHPRLELQAAVVAARRAALDLEQAEAVQDVSVGGGVRFLREGTDATFVAGVSVPLPLRNRNQGNIRAAREMLAGAEQATRAIESELRVAFATAWQELHAAHATARALRRDALPATEDAAAIVRRAYDAGELPLIDVLDAQRALVAIRRDILDAEAAYVVALAQVEGLTALTFPATSALLAPE